MEIRYVIRSSDGFPGITRKYPTDAGLDLYCAEESVEIMPNSLAIVATGVSIELPKNFMGQVWPKSRSNFLIGGGIIDEGYLGPILVKIFNPTANRIKINLGDPIAQLVLVPTIYPEPKRVSNDLFRVAETPRGTTGGIVEQQKKTFITGQFDFVE